MSKIEALATHDRDMPWVRRGSQTKPVRELTSSHIHNIIQLLEHRLRQMASYPPTHPSRRHEGRSKYHLTVMKAELEWRKRNGL